MPWSCPTMLARIVASQTPKTPTTPASRPLSYGGAAMPAPVLDAP